MQDNDKRSWSEEIEVAGSELLERVKELIAEGNVRRLRIKGHDGSVIVEVPLSVGAVVGSVVTLAAPILAILGVFAALVGHAKIEIIRDTPGGGSSAAPGTGAPDGKS